MVHHRAPLHLFTCDDDRLSENSIFLTKSEYKPPADIHSLAVFLRLFQSILEMFRNAGVRNKLRMRPDYPLGDYPSQKAFNNLELKES
jgi:hypothetical protein